MGLDAQTLRQVLRDFFRFNPKDFFVQASPTGFSISAAITNRNPQEQLKGFQLISDDDETGYFLRVVESTLVGGIPNGFSPGDDPQYRLMVNDGDKIYGVISIDVEGEFPGDVLTRDLAAAPEIPEDDGEGGIFYIEIGTVRITDNNVSAPVNDRYGPIDGTGFRMWFSNPKQFGWSWV